MTAVSSFEETLTKCGNLFEDLSLHLCNDSLYCYVDLQKNIEGNDECLWYVSTPLRLWLKSFMMLLQGMLSSSSSPSLLSSMGEFETLMNALSLHYLFCCCCIIWCLSPHFSLWLWFLFLLLLTVFMIRLINSCPPQLLLHLLLFPNCHSFLLSIENLVVPSFVDWFSLLFALLFSSGKEHKR